MIPRRFPICRFQQVQQNASLQDLDIPGRDGSGRDGTVRVGLGLEPSPVLRVRLLLSEDPDRGIGSDSVRTRGYEHPVLQWSEKEFQSSVIEVAEALGWLVYHPHDSRRSAPGFPDLVMVHERHGQVLYRELKTEKGKASKDQERWLGVLAAVGSDAGLWRPSDWVSGLIQRVLSGGSRA